MSKDNFKLTVLLLLGGLFFFYGNGRVHLFDWDEINFAECAREMLVSKDWLIVQINFLPFWEKPPLFIWLQAISMNVLGINEFAARLPNAICGLFYLIIFSQVGKKLVSREFGLIWSIGFAICLLPCLYFKSGIIDPWFNLFMFLGIWYFYLYESKNKSIWIQLSGIMTGLSVLTKGPVGLLIVGGTIGIYILIYQIDILLKWKFWIGFILGTILTGGTWFLMLVLNGKTSILTEFVQYQIRLFSTPDSGHGGPFIYHFVVLLIGCFPLSIFAISKVIPFRVRYTDVFSKLMIIAFWLVLLLFSIAKTKIVHYSSFCYIPLCYFAALRIREIIKEPNSLYLIEKIGLIGIGFILTLPCLVLPFIPLNALWLEKIGISLDLETNSILKDALYWSPWLAAFSVVYLLAIFNLALFKYARKFSGMIVFFLCAGLWLVVGICYIVPNIEYYSQKKVIEYYKLTAKNKEIAIPIGFKSYAQYFYQNTNTTLNQDSLLNDKNEIPLKLIGKLRNKDSDKNYFPGYDIEFAESGHIYYRKSN